MSERARLAAEVESLKASTAAEASSSKAELGAQRDKLEQQLADLATRTEALTAGECVLFVCQRWLHANHMAEGLRHPRRGGHVRCYRH